MPANLFTPGTLPDELVARCDAIPGEIHKAIIDDPLLGAENIHEHIAAAAMREGLRYGREERNPPLRFDDLVSHALNGLLASGQYTERSPEEVVELAKSYAGAFFGWAQQSKGQWPFPTKSKK